MFRILSYSKLRAKLVSLGYRPAEIKSTVSQVRRFDRDLKLAVYHWLREDVVPGENNPAFLIDQTYSIKNLCDDFGYSFLGAMSILQTYRKKPDEARKILFRAGAHKAPEISAEDLAYINQKYGITAEELKVKEDEADIPIDDNADDAKGEA